MTFSATAQTSSFTADEKAWISRQPPVRVGITPDWAPFSYFTPDGKAAGIDVDILELISKRTGLRFEIVRTGSWPETMDRVRSGGVGMVSGISETEERAQLFDFTQPYYRSAVVIVSREGDRRFSDISLLNAARIAMPRNYVTTAALRERLPSKELLLADSLSECFEMVRHNEADVVVDNLFAASRYFNEHPEARLSISGAIPEFEFPLRFGVVRGHTSLVHVINEALASIPQAEFDQITGKHLQFNLQGAHRVSLLRQRILQFAGISLGVAIVLGVWIFYLLREIRARRAAEAGLRETNRSLEVFSHSVSHDLRGPLRTISGMAEILKEERGSQLGAQGIVFLDRIIASVARMNTLMCDVLAYTHASRGQFPISLVNLRQTVDQVVDDFPVEQRQFFHVASDLPDVPANPTLLSQCLSNLLGNAIKFVPKDREPNIHIGVEKQGAFIRLWVDDNGIGVAPEHQGRIFRVFERVQTGSYEGTGIGLAIVAKAAERMGGTAGVSSQPGQASRFWIDLPATNPKAQKG